MTRLDCRSEAAQAERLASLAIAGREFSAAQLDHLTQPIVAAYNHPACEAATARRISVALDLLNS